MKTGAVPAHNAKLYLRHSNSTDILTEEGRQINNSNLNPTAAYQQDGAPRMGFSREPADFAFASYVKTKSKDVDSTEGKNVLQAMSHGGGMANPAPSSEAPAQSEKVVETRQPTAPEAQKGAAINVTM